MSSGQKLQTQLDCLTSLANMTGVLHGLFGTYELLIFRDLSTQLSLRTINIHFPRYKPDNPKDLKAFKSILFTFQRHLPLREEPDLIAENNKNSSKPKGSHRVGQRKPKRDSIGVSQNAQ